MTVELKGTVINMKTLSQDIKDPILIGAAEANGRWLTVIFTQEAAAQFSDTTHVYLSWRHIQKDVKGYNAFNELPREDTDLLTAEEQPPVWQIYFPKEMLHEGDVIATIELVDNISVSASQTFSIHIAADPWEGTDWIEQDDLSEFKTAVNWVKGLQENIDNAHAEINARLDELEKMNDFIDFIDENQDGINDEDVISIPTDDGIEIIEWTGEEEGGE